MRWTMNGLIILFFHWKKRITEQVRNEDAQGTGNWYQSFLRFNTWAAFQGTPDHAAVAGDFTILEDEVEPVIKARVENGIEVVAVHNHMVHEHPRIIFLHYWCVGNAEQLAKGLKQPLIRPAKKRNIKPGN